MDPSTLRMYARFATGLPRHLRRRITLDEARAIVAGRLARREENFLHLVERAIWARPASPYRWLLGQARVEPGDLASTVRRDGLELALSALRDAGVYVTFEEFRGTAPIVRDGQVLQIRSSEFGNPLLAGSHELESGGSTGIARRVTTNLADLSAQAPALLLFHHAHEVVGLPMALWSEPLPASGLNSVLMRIPCGAVPERWFTSLGSDYRPALRFRVANRATLAIAHAVGVKIPRPEHLPFDNALKIVRWACEARDRAGGSHVGTTVSRAVRIAVVAREAGLNLSRVILSAGGEPPTDAKAYEIRRSGASLASHYFFTEIGAVGLGCARSSDPNDQHFLADHLAVIAHPRTVPGSARAVGAFHFTTLLPTARNILLNVESDDYGRIESRECGCPLGEVGYDLHVLGIRSFRKLTGEGITLVGSDLERILEETLPARFGGTPLDYQFTEEEDERGRTRIVLVASPRLELPDEGEVVAQVLEAMERLGDGGGLARAVLESADAVRVRRAEPRWTSRGKFLPLDSGLPSTRLDYLDQTTLRGNTRGGE
jgi:hypothetical protein